MKCKYCNKAATYDSPKQLCDVHWARWWSDGFHKDARKAIYREIRELDRKVGRKEMSRGLGNEKCGMCSCRLSLCSIRPTKSVVDPAFKLCHICAHVESNDVKINGDVARAERWAIMRPKQPNLADFC